MPIRGLSLVWKCADKAKGLDNHLHIFKIQAKLITCAQSLWCQLLKTGHVLSVRRDASSCCTVKVIWQFYRALWHNTAKWVLMLKIYCRRIQAWRSKERYYQLPTVTENLYLLPHLFLSKIQFELQHTKCALTKCNAHTFCCVHNISKFNELADVSNDTLFVNLHCNNSLYTQSSSLSLLHKTSK